MFQALALIAVGALSRFAPHVFPEISKYTWNLVPMGAIALYVGARLPKRLAWSVPVFAMIFSDIVMDQWYGNYFDSPTRWLSYSTLGAIALMGLLAKGPKAGVVRLAGLSLAGSTLFFLTSNFGCWMWFEGTPYPHTFAGLMQCYVAAIPFYKNSVMADLAGTGLLFGGVPLLANAWRSTSAGIPAGNSADLATSSH